MDNETKIKCRRYIALITKAILEKRELSPEEREEVISIRDGLGKNHEEMIRAAGKVLIDDVSK